MRRTFARGQYFRPLLLFLLVPSVAAFSFRFPACLLLFSRGRVCFSVTSSSRCPGLVKRGRALTWSNECMHSRLVLGLFPRMSCILQCLWNWLQREEVEGRGDGISGSYCVKRRGTRVRDALTGLIAMLETTLGAWCLTRTEISWMDSGDRFMSAYQTHY